MSSTYTADPPSRAWWSIGQKQPPQGLQHQFPGDKSARSSGLNSIAVALGLKSKKHSLLTIQDPAHLPRPSVPAIITKTPNRPPSKSVSSIRSRVDSMSPYTPQDSHRDNRHSLLTISDTDPFAVHAISSPPHTPYDPNRLSAHSNSSNPDFMTKSAEPVLNRTSYASTSSQSNAHGSDLSSTSPTIDSSKRLRTKKSIGSLHRKQSLMSGDQSLGSAWESLTSANKSIMQATPLSTTLVPDKNRFSQLEATPMARPPMRARGMTESSAIQRPSFLPGESTIPTSSSSSSLHMSSLPSPRVIIRQPSVSRIGLPPSAPPRQELPPPPPVADRKLKDDDFEIMMPVSTSSASSSSLSFASSIPDTIFNQSYSPRKKEKTLLERSISTGAGESALDTSFKGLSSPPPRTLKKAVSHQSLGRRSSHSASPAPAPVPLPELPALPSKAPRKQRSFHQPKFPLPLPPLSPLRQSNNSSVQASFPLADPQSSNEQRRGSAGGLSMPGRKRLFSGSRRPSTSQSALPEDDNQSVFSVRSVPEQSMTASIFKSMSQPLSPAPNSSFWDEGALEPPLSPQLVAHEYTPQPIMTPAEMATFEASVDGPSNSNLKRGLSILSTSTMVSTTSDGDHETLPQNDLSTEPPSLNAVANRLMTRSTSLMQKGLSTPPRLAVRPSTSQASMTSPTLSERSSPISRSPSPSLTSLPPPPRRSRPRATVMQDEPPALPSLPPPPGRKYVRPKMSVEKILHRRSIMRKPSFLEISDDESERDTDVESLELPSGSFLDLARESFDTTISE